MGWKESHDSSMGCPPISSKPFDITNIDTTTTTTTITNMSLSADSTSLKPTDSKELERSSEDCSKTPLELIGSSTHQASDDHNKVVTAHISRESKILRNGVERKRKGKLLVLDLNGILADVVGVAPKGYKPDRKFKAKSVFKRPFCEDFLNFCFEKFDVGIWSSRIRKNVDFLVEYLLGGLRHQLLFCWDGSYCTTTGFRTLENRHKPLVLKEMNKLWEKHDHNLPWQLGEYNESNTLLLDDSPYKAIRNPPYTAIFPYSFKLFNQTDNSLGPGGDIRVYLEELSTAENFQTYVEQHPFGQGQISPSDDLFRKVNGM